MFITYSLVKDDTVLLYLLSSTFQLQYNFNFTDLWMNYIKEELSGYGNPEKCGNLHWRAIKTLEGESVDRFTTQYTLLQIGHI